MKRPTTPTILLAICLLTAVGTFLGLRPRSQSSPALMLHVPVVGQEMSQWCWAATTEMVTAYYHGLDARYQYISQCQLVHSVHPNFKIDCDQLSKSDSVVNLLGNPFTGVKTYSVSGWNGANPMPYSILASEFAAGRPVIFQWGNFGVTPGKKSDITLLTGTDYPIGTHFLVAEGLPYSNYSDSLWVSTNDPLPLGQGAHKIISYSAFAGCIPSSRQPNKRHVYDPTTIFYQNCGAIYQIKPIRSNR